MQLLNIPEALRSRPQWACCGENKVPIDPKTLRAADPTDPRTWGTFEQAVQAGFKHVGFMLHDDDPFCIIDLDNKVDAPAPPEELERFAAIIEAFQTYTEWSASGRGYHLILEGSIERGARRGHVEVYSRARFMICTGNVHKDLPIARRDELLANMYSQLAPQGSSIELDEDGEETLTDREVHERAMSAENAIKYDLLTRGPESWREGSYPSQSEADLALMSMLAFYSKSNAQCRRMFLLSPLGQRDKAQRPDYLDRMLKVARARLAEKAPPPVDFDLAAKLAAKIRDAGGSVPLPPVAKEGDPFEYPPGLVGECAEYIFRTSIRPVREIALAASLALCAGVCGRSYNTTTKAGLNQYIIMLAKTGCGKEAAASGIDRIVNAVRRNVPAVSDFLGPAHFASAPAIVRTLTEQPSFVSVLGEVGITLQAWSDPRASATEKMIFKVLLDCHGKSGFHQSLKSTAYSDKEKTTKLVQAPALTILGESVPDKYYQSLDVDQIASGLIPRFLVVEYDGKRPEMNEATDVEMPSDLQARMCDLCMTVLTARQNNACLEVPMDPDALHIMRGFNKHADDAINEANTDVEHQLWNRAHLNALKLATLVAVGVNHRQPMVKGAHALWACRFVEHCVTRVLARFVKGEIGEQQGDAHVDKAIAQYVHMTPEQRIKAGATFGTANHDGVAIPFKFFYSRLRLRKPFKDDRRGAAKAVEDVLTTYVHMDKLQIVPQEKAREVFGVRNTRVYVIGPEYTAPDEM